ncbi:LptF/LptG family permease [Caminibacter mediatlanticus TB-2]|uniref:LptF/LptG family permease n=1 Tax=Caminibacter mediatlanticus TB-2 TaxID=391592 RepID=A0AAI9F336_9BACT|nr:LptF/LptG family permease [Caminibacter mediatlanticus]EDM24395.1 hypothetical protein CMTB2_02728 [Caminibacter mediatlanticus TB-2]QCT95046.1 LptF/LptG family permease [Caminibacter mediatlanticus TB-2]
MRKISVYILNQFLPLFLTIFFVISAIISLIYIITISNITSKIQITFIELLKFYILSMPQILLITLAISFFISAINLYSKLSETQELIALFSLGFKPKTLLNPILLLAILLTFINLFILFISIPYAKMNFNNLKNEKKQEAKFNFQSSQVSQQFGDWVIFANKGKNNSFTKIYLYSPKENKFIISQNAQLQNKNSVLNFALTIGNIYDFNKSMQIKFNKMEINQLIPKVKISIFNFKDYFKYNKKEFAKYLPIALLPITLFFFIPLISFFHPRLNKSHPLFYAITILSIYSIVSLSNKNFILSILISVLFFIIGGILYKWKVKF